MRELLDKPTATNFLTSQSAGFHAALALNALLISISWTYFVSHGFTANGIVDGLYEIQAAMLSQARLSIVPGPMERYYQDALMYWGQYYFYWGLLPSTFLFVLTRFLGRLAAHYLLVIGFIFLFVYFYQRIIAKILECASQNNSMSAGVVAGSTVLLTWLLIFTIPYPHELGWFFGRFAVYEQQILFGLALAVPGLFFLITGLKDRRSGPVALAALFFVLASCTRVTWFPLALVMLIVAAALVPRWWKLDELHSSPRRDMLILSVCLILMFGLLLINYVRFGSPWDFGIRYANPQLHVYLRTQKIFFSPITMLWNTVFNIASYYASPRLVEQLGLFSRSFSNYEGFPPSLFFFNPQFLPLAALVPLALYKTIKSRTALALWLGIFAAATLYLNLILGVFGTFVILRYFVEFYYLLIVVFLAALLSLVPPRYGLPVFIALLALQIPPTVRDFQNHWPLLRTINAQNGLRVTSAAVWPTGSLSSAELGRMPRYAVIGAGRGTEGTLLGKDIFAVYVVPAKVDGETPRTTLEIRGLQTLHEKGKALIFLENRLLASQALKAGQAVDVHLELPFALMTRAPYQVMVIFLADGESYLPGRARNSDAVAFREVSLKTALGPEAAKYLPSGHQSQ